MNRCHVTAAALIVFSVAGCAHLEQAPLVYSSKSSVGIDISTTSLETPGLSMNVGYKQVDAAYVPVAVARACNDKSSPAACSGDAYKMHLITGHSDAGDSASDKHSLDASKKLEAFGDLAETYAAAAEAVTRAQDRVTAAEKHIQQLITGANEIRAKEAAYQNRKAELEILQSSMQPSQSTDIAADVIDAQRTISEIESLKPKPDEKASLDSYAANIDSANSEFKTAAQDLIAKKTDAERKKILLTQAQEAINQVNRDDSYSVFGSFEASSKARAKEGEASVGLGKIFATGVASQNISDGLSNLYRTRSTAACYETIATVTAKGTSAADLAGLLAGCRAKPDK